MVSSRKTQCQKAKTIGKCVVDKEGSGAETFRSATPHWDGRAIQFWDAVHG